MTLLYLQNHYDVEEIDLGYQFVTQMGVTYFLTFISYPTVSDFLSTKIYMFNIDRACSADCTCGQDDVKVRNTILFIIELFFQKHEDALITICDIIDGKQFARKCLFDFWYKEFNNNRLVKLEADCLVDNTPTFASLFFSANHYNKAFLEQEFLKLVEINFYS